jgi:hypothetical protein
VYKETMQNRYSAMAAKARGEQIHPGPLTLRRSKAPPDRTFWVREDKQNTPYSFFDTAAARQSSPTVPKQNSPPMWLPKRRANQSTMMKGAEEESSTASPSPGPAASSSDDKKPWDKEHNIMVSRGNHEVTCHNREYFDRPMMKEGEGVIKIYERYSMNDRQCGWNDHPSGSGARNTYLDHCIPHRDMQVPSHWRNVKNWNCFSVPDMHDVHRSIGRHMTSSSPKRSILESLADTPADQSKKFWRTWAEEHAQVKKDPRAPQAWDHRHSHSATSHNLEVDQRNREYFSVAEGLGGQGRAIVGPSPRVWRSQRKSYDRFTENVYMKLA